MCRVYSPVILYFILFTGPHLFGVKPVIPVQFPVILVNQDTITENQILHNGRIWKNLYYMVEGDQFLFSREFLPGSVTISGKTFENLFLRYDIYKDEVLTPVVPGGILQLNKEMVDSFTLTFRNKPYLFISMPEDTLTRQKSYYNIIYKGKTALCISYVKKIDKLATEGKYDKFYQLTRIYFVKDSMFYLISSKRDLMSVLVGYKEPIKKFIKEKRLDVTVREPESLIPVIRYYDSISQ